jgi:hypothetical protein
MHEADDLRERPEYAEDELVSPNEQHGEWQKVGAVLGHEDFVVGPSPRDPAGEALVLVPPGVRIPAPEGSEQRVSTEGWRVALWNANSKGERHVDVGKPTYVCLVPLAFVIGLVEAECSDHLTWVADRLALPILNACAVQHADRGGRVFSFADRWRNDAEAMLDELDIALATLPPGQGGADGDSEQADDLVIDPELSRARAWPQQPGKFDERLSVGTLRQMYDEHLHARVAHRSA